MSTASFDGPTKTISLSGTSSLNIKEDVYSAWKRWVQQGDNSKYLPAIRSIGGDPVGNGLFAADIYFMLNGWKIIISSDIRVSGILYDETSGIPYIVQPGGSVYATVSNLAYGVSTSGGGGASASDVADEVVARLQSTLNAIALEATAQKTLQAARTAAALNA